MIIYLTIFNSNNSYNKYIIYMYIDIHICKYVSMTNMLFIATYIIYIYIYVKYKFNNTF